MRKGTVFNTPSIVWRYPFGRFSKVVDVGGGTGYLVRSILHAYPSIKEGICFDTPEVIARADEDILLGERYQRIGGDFFDFIPSADLFILRQIMHDWDDERCMQVLENIGRSLNAGGKVLVVDAVLRPGHFDDFYQLLDLQMLVLADGGRERTIEEFKHILDRSGFELNRVVPTGTGFSMLEAVKKQ
jgi:SAM-dependent methyltransferase